MTIVFLPGALADLRWFHRYYTQRFPAERDNASRRLRAVLALLGDHPRIGRAVDGEAGLRSYPVPRTPFTVLYRARSDRLEILRVYDQRSAFANRGE